MLEDSYRLFNCARCLAQVRICPRCDRGQIYCGRSCSIRSRREKQLEAGRRYQDKFEGRLRHAARQQQYRERQSQKVTHQGPPAPGPSCIMTSDDVDEELIAELAGVEVVFCDFCRRPCRPFARLDPLRARRRDRLRVDRTRAS